MEGRPERVEIELPTVDRAARAPAVRCCDLHNVHCEPPSELCCLYCTELAHPAHADGSPCVLANQVM